MKRLLTALITTLALGAFGTTAGAEKPEMSPEAQSLWDTELAFAASVADKDYEKFLSLIDENAIFSGGATLRGRTAVGEGWKVFFTEHGPKLVWEPARVLVRPSGDIGTSTGPYRLTSIAEDGTTRTSEGTFFSVWERQDDGSWKIIFDGGTPPTPVEDK